MKIKQVIHFCKTYGPIASSLLDISILILIGFVFVDISQVVRTSSWMMNLNHGGYEQVKADDGIRVGCRASDTQDAWRQCMIDGAPRIGSFAGALRFGVDSVRYLSTHADDKQLADATSAVIEKGVADLADQKAFLYALDAFSSSANDSHVYRRVFGKVQTGPGSSFDRYEAALKDVGNAARNPAACHEHIMACENKVSAAGDVAARLHVASIALPVFRSR